MKQFILLWLCLAVTAWGQYVPRPASSGVATTDFDTLSELNTIVTDADLAILGANTFTGAQTNSTAGAASAPALHLTGVPFAGTGTTSFPLLYIKDASATASTTLNTAGTYLGINIDGTQDGINVLKDGTSVFKVKSTGETIAEAGVDAQNIQIGLWNANEITLTTAGYINFGNDTYFSRPAARVVGVGNNATTSTGGTLRFVPTSPAQITADQNNYNPGGTSYYQRWSTDASRSITGMTFTAAQVDGQTHVIANVGAQNIVIVNESASSTAANRFHNSTGADITIAADQEVNCWYDGTTARWRVTKRGF